MQETDYRVLPNFANRIKAGELLRVDDQGNQTRTFCYVTDALVGWSGWARVPYRTPMI